MHNHPEQFTRDLHTVSLTAEEQKLMRDNLRAMAALNPAPSGVWKFFTRHVVAFSAAAFVLLAGTTAGAAQNALPGDFLYPVRVGINERVALVVAGGEDARMNRELEQLERALEEEELVAAYAIADFMVGEDISTDQRREQRADENDEGDGEAKVAGGASDRTGKKDDATSVEVDAELEAELRALEHLLDEEADVVEIELSL